ncbi:hypothetical protein CapIbe_020071 [Capra ibex]
MCRPEDGSCGQCQGHDAPECLPKAFTPAASHLTLKGAAGGGAAIGLISQRRSIHGVCLPHVGDKGLEGAEMDLASLATLRE